MDARIAIWVATHRIEALNQVFVGLGDAERLGLLWIALAVAICLGMRCRWPETAMVTATTAIATFAADSVAFGIKDLTSRARPFEAHPQIKPLYVVHSSSFPAGHAATAFAGATLLALLVPRAAPVLLATAALIGFSRVYVGVHYPTDVLAGAAVGVVVGAAVWWVLRAALAHGLPPLPRPRRGTSGDTPNVSS